MDRDDIIINRRLRVILFGNLIFGFLLSVISFGTSFCQPKSGNYHIFRSDISNCFNKFVKKKKGQVAFLGGSITYNPGWRDSICAYLEKRFPETDFDFIPAGIPSMGSTPGAFRLERDILSKGKTDLLFVEAAVNDPTNGRTTPEQIRGMEGIIRHARNNNPKVDIVSMYFVDPDKMKSYNVGEIPEVILNHEKVASHYKVSSINLAKEVTDRINAGEFTWENDFKDLHPSPFGQIIYYNSIKIFLDSAWAALSISASKATKYASPDKLDAFCYDRGKLASIDNADIGSGWKIIPDWTPGAGQNTRKGFVNVPMLVSDTPGSELQFDFKGKAVGIAVAAGPDTGAIEYSIDGGKFKSVDLFTKWSKHLHLPWYYVLEAELKHEKHSLKIRISENRNPASNDHACRIKHFFINE
ncbi:MAG: SGNH/GDSL hydrolase family protein [Cytophagales bacterium]|nr:SGNH/GDSL hydrolase family protein [Cytophagales bacterium]